MGKGVTLSKEELEKLRDVLGGKIGINSGYSRASENVKGAGKNAI